MERTEQSRAAASSNVTRRKFFLAATGAAAAMGAAGLPGTVHSRIIGAGDRLGVGFIGVGGRGMSHVSALIGMINQGENLRIVAINDAYRPRMEKAAARAKAKTYPTHRELLADKDIDIVCIATPDRLHVPQALDAIRAGKDVYCEKPMGHWSQIAQSRELFQETRRLGRVVQVGNQGNSSSAWRKVGDLLQKGSIGRVQHVQAGYYRLGDWGERMPVPDANAKPGPDLDWEAFLGDAPKVPFDVRRFFSWRMFLDYAGGPCTDLFPHVFTPFVSLLGLKFPSLVATSGGIFKYNDYGREVPDTFNMCIDYPEKLSVVLVCTLANQHMTEPAIRGDEGTITLQNVTWEAGFETVTVHPPKGEPTVIKGEMPNSTLAHWRNFLDCVRSRQKPVSDVEFGYHVQAVLCMAMQGFLQKRTARFDPDKGEVML